MNVYPGTLGTVRPRTLGIRLCPLGSAGPIIWVMHMCSHGHLEFDLIIFVRYSPLELEIGWVHTVPSQG